MKPYPGLRPFETEEKDLFFGRDEECAILIDKILAQRLTLLFAASGVGKTSLLRAAVVPRLTDPEGEHLDVVVHRDWVEEPIAGLKQSIVEALRKAGRIGEDTLAAEVESTSLMELCELCALFVRSPLVLMLDQFEELFRYQRRAKTFEPFLAQLGQLVAERSLQVSVVLSMREDFALELNALKPFVPGPLFENFFRLERLPVERAREAIVAPVVQAGFHYQPELVEALLSDLADREDEGALAVEIGKRRKTVEPPYLQIVCSELWEFEQGGEGRLLRFGTYHDRGRAAGLLKTYLERVLGELGVLEKRLASRAFDHLITRRGTKMAYTVGDLAGAIRVEEKELENTLEQLEKAKILRRQARRGLLWYELHHDIFSRIVDEWNRAYKAHRQRRYMVQWATICVMVGCMLWMAYDAAVTLTAYHLRLDSRRGVSDAVEIYRGNPESLDLFGLSRYVAQTDIDRKEIEPRHVFRLQRLSRIESSELEAAGFLRPEDQVAATWEAGYAGEALKLAARSMSEYDSVLASRVAVRLTGFGSLDSFDLLRHELRTIHNYATKKAIFEALSHTHLPTAAAQLKAELVDESPSVSAEINLSNGEEGCGVATSRIVDILDHPSYAVRSSAVELLGCLRDKQVLGPLITRLSDPEARLRQRVIEVLSRLGDVEVANSLIANLRDPDSLVRSSAAWALGFLDSEQSVKPLIEKLGDESEAVRSSAAWALGALGRPTAEGFLIARLGDESEAVRSSAAWALGSLGGAQVEDLLVASLDDQNAEVRSSAAWALGNLGSVTAAELLITKLDDEAESVRSSAAWALGALGGMQAVSPLIARLGDPNSQVRSSALWALGSLGSAQAEKMLIASLEDASAEVRSSSAWALGALGIVKATDLLIAKFNDSDAKVRSSAAWALGTLGSVKAEDLLIAKLGDSAAEVRSSAAWALGTLGSLKAEDLLTERLEDSDSRVRSSAAWALGALGSLQVQDLLITKLRDPDAEVRSNVVKALGALGSVRAESPLITRLSDPDAQVRASAAWALGRLRSARSVPTLISNLADSRIVVREETIFALSALKPEFAYKTIVEIFHREEPDSQLWPSLAFALLAFEDEQGLAALETASRSPRVHKRRHVSAILSRIGTEAALPLLEVFLGDTDRRVREAAIAALGRIHSPINVARLREIATEADPIPISYAQLAVDALRNIGTSEAIVALQEAVRINEAFLGFRVYRHLADLGATQALPQLQERLHKLETDHRAWRKLRDRDTSGMPAEEERAHSQRVAAECPETAWGWEVAHAIARLDQEAGIRLLNHDLAKVREGAAYGLAQAGGVALVERLDKARDSDHSYPFRVGAFRAIDHTLRYIEHTGGPAEREALQELIKKVKDREAVCTRIEFTIQMLDRENPIERGQCASLLPKDL